VRRTPYQEVISDELKLGITELIASDDKETSTEGLEFILEFCIFLAINPLTEWAQEQARIRKIDISTKAAHSEALRTLALHAGIISLEQAIKMPGGLGALMSDSAYRTRIANIEPYPVRQYTRLARSPSYQNALLDFTAIGKHVISIRTPPWASGIPYYHGRFAISLGGFPDSRKPQLNPVCGLGVGALMAINAELGRSGRIDESAVIETLPMPQHYKELFRLWATHKLNVVELRDE
jgi:hypothetical protein